MTFCDTSSSVARLGLFALLMLAASFTASPALAQGDPLITDGSFEAGTPSAAWTEFSNGPGGTPICSSATCGGGPNGAFEGDWWLWFGRGTDGKIASVAQEVTIPDTVNTLSFYLQIPEADKAGTLRVQIGSTIVFQATEDEADTYAEYQQVLVDVSAFANGTAQTLTFLGVIGASAGEELVSLFVDQVSLDNMDLSTPSFSVDPEELEFTVLQGGTSEPQTLILTNDGDAEGTFSVETVVLRKRGLSLGAPSGTSESSAKTLSGLMPPTPGIPVRGGEIVADGSFEGGTPNPNWDEASTNFGTPICDATTCGTGGGTGPFEGQFWTWFGGADNVEESGSVEQNLTIPMGATMLSFQLEIAASDAPGFVSVQIDGDEVFRATEADAATYGTYQEVTVDISEFADGDSHTLRFESTTEGGSGTTNFFVDLVQIMEGDGGDTIVLAVDPESGTVGMGSSQDIDVTVDATGAELGTYDAQVIITTDDEDNPEIVVDVTVEVNPISSNEDGVAQAGFALRPSYPNPFAARTTMTYVLTEAADVRLEVFDITGRRVATLANAREGIGSHEVEWDATGLPSGTYVVRLNAEGRTAQQRLTLVR